jgi:hypothetical protein
MLFWIAFETGRTMQNYFEDLFRLQSSGTDVMLTIFLRFLTIFAFFSKTNVTIKFLHYYLALF